MNVTPRSFGSAIAAAGLLLSTTASAYPVHRRWFQATYETPTRCELCHVQGGSTERNPYGKDWQRRGESPDSFGRVAALDSDGDGLSNLDEIRRRSNPGDPNSTPDQPGRTWKTPLVPPVPREQLALVFGDDVETIDAWEPDLGPAQIRTIETRLGRRLGASERYPTLYFGARGGRRASAALFCHYTVGANPFSILVAIDEQGVIRKAVPFRTVDKARDAYRGYLDCLVGKNVAAVGLLQPNECPAAAGADTAALTATADAVRAALWTVKTLIAARPATESSPSPASDAGASDDRAAAPLDLAAAPAHASVAVPPRRTMAALAVLSIAVLAALIALTARLATRRPSTPAVRQLPELAELAPSQKMLVVVAVLSLLLVQLIGAVDAYVQTQLVHESVLDYFQYLSWARLLGTSHAHLFGFAIMYGFMGLLVSMSSASELAKCAVIATLLWSSVFDVLSWWGIKKLSHSFEWLSIATGIAISTASVVACVLIARNVFERRATREETER